MNHTLKQLLLKVPDEVRQAFFDARSEMTSQQAIAEHDRVWETMLMREQRKCFVCGAGDRRDSPRHKRVDRMMTG